MDDHARDEAGDWPSRPWVLGAIAALAGLIFDALTDHPSGGLPRPGLAASATFVAVATLSFILTVEKRRWWWSLAFALAWGLVVALIGWFTAGYNSKPTIFEWPFFSGLFAVMLAAPLFQTVRDEGGWRFSYPVLHRHVWVDAVIGAASLFFTGLSFLLAWLIAGLFSIIGLDFVRDLLSESAFAWMLAGLAFGGAVGLLREREKLLGTLYRLLTTILSVLAPVLAAALVLFLLSLPLTGLGELWKSNVPATPMLLLAAAGAFALANAVLGDGEQGEENRSNLLRQSALALIVCILPLAVVAGLSIGQRIGQYGWTPERIWGVLAVAVAVAYGIAGWWSVGRRRAHFDQALRPLQTQLAIGLCALALFLALPILDFGAISASSQLARLERSNVTADKFDWQAMAFDFGPAGRRRLAEIARSGPADQRRSAGAALRTNSRYEVAEAVEAATSAPVVARNLRMVPEGTSVPSQLRNIIERNRFCRFGPCVLTMTSADKAILVGSPRPGTTISSLRIARGKDGRWSEYDHLATSTDAPPPAPDLTGSVEIRSVERRQLFVDGEPVGEVFE